MRSGGNQAIYKAIEDNGFAGERPTGLNAVPEEALISPAKIIPGL